MELRTLTLIAIVGCLAANFLEVKSAELLPSLEGQCPTEQHRLRYHFTPRKNWINDPNGLVYYDGVYHLFYQYHPYSSGRGPMHWGHATSSDLFNWEEQDIALYPDEVGDCWSGSSVVDSTNTTGFKTDPDVDPLVAIYTSAGGAGQSQSVAYSNDKGVTFTKYAQNPAIPNPNIQDFRDPKVSYIQGQWVMTLAVGNRVEFYGSPDLKAWTLLSEFGRDPEEGSHCSSWECPDLFPLVVDVSGNGTAIVEYWVLLVSIGCGGPTGGSGTQYFIGNFNGTTFTSLPWDNKQWLDWGPDNYAAVSYSNEPQGRAILMGWMNNLKYGDGLPTTSWRGQMTIPRTLDLLLLDKELQKFRLTSMPVEEAKILRHPTSKIEIKQKFTVAVDETVVLTPNSNFSPGMEVEIHLETELSPQFSICAYNSLGEEVCFGYEDSKWYLDRSKSGNTNFHSGFEETLRATADREVFNEEITIRMFVDVSSMEVFVDNGLTVMTSLFYATEPLDMVYVRNGPAVGSNAGLKVASVTVWALKCTFLEDEPVTGTTEPVTGTTEPVTGTTEPVTGTTEPVTRTTEPVTGTTEPVTGTTEPVTGTTEPVTGTTEPVTGTTEPVTVTTEPVTGTTEPVTVTTEPVTGTTEPVTGTTEPVTGTTEPVTVTTEPVTGTTEPGSSSTISLASKTGLLNVGVMISILLISGFFVIAN